MLQLSAETAGWAAGNAYQGGTGTVSENKKSTAGTEETDPAATMGLQMYRDLNMSSDAVIHLMPRVHDERKRQA